MSQTKSIGLLALSFALHVFCRPTTEAAPLTPRTDMTCSNTSFTLVSDSPYLFPYRQYKTINATSNQLEITQNGEELADGLLFLGLENSGLFGWPGTKQESALIMSTDGDLVWAGPEGSTSNFRAQTLNGEPVITVWTGSGAAASNGAAAHGYGHVDILNNKYETIYTVCPKLEITFPAGQSYPCVADVHESYITENNTMLVTVYNTTEANLSSLGGPENGWVLNPIAVEVNVSTNEALWIWNPLDHVPFSASNYPIMNTGTNSSNPWDWFHMNSIQSHNGNYLINSRQTWSSYYVSRAGDVMWELNGKTGGDFGPLPPGGNFSWEHDVRIRDLSDTQSIVTMFNDYNGYPLALNASVGLGLTLTMPPNKDQPPEIYTYLADSEDPVYAYAEGSYGELDNGNVLVGYGLRPVVKEFGTKSKNSTDVRWSANFGYVNNNNTVSSYRTYKQVWKATPSATLSVVVEDAGDSDPLSSCANGSSKRGYVSWNGATDVISYALYTGSGSSDLKEVSKFDKKGFETEFVVPSGAKFVQVAAIEESGEVGRSKVLTV